MESRNYHELHNRLFDGKPRFFSSKNIVIMICRSGRHRSVANAELWLVEHAGSLQSTSTLRFFAACV